MINIVLHLPFFNNLYCMYNVIVVILVVVVEKMCTNAHPYAHTHPYKRTHPYEEIKAFTYL